MHPSLVRAAKNAVPVHLVTAKDAKAFLAGHRSRAGLAAAGFAGREGGSFEIVTQDCSPHR